MSQQHQGIGNNINAERDVNFYVEPKHLSLLSAIVNTLGKKLYIGELGDGSDYLPFNIDDKIEYNHIKGYKPIINEYKIYVGKLSAIYKEYDEGGTNKTQITLSNIKNHYLKARMAFIAKYQVNNEEDIVVIRRYADSIIMEVEEKLLEEVRRSSNIEETVETINISLQIVMIDALMRCKILEKP